MLAHLMSFERGVRISGGLVLLGLIIEIITLNWSHPTSIIWYMTIGGGCFFVGVVYYLALLMWSNKEE